MGVVHEAEFHVRVVLVFLLGQAEHILDRVGVGSQEIVGTIGLRLDPLFALFVPVI